MRVAVLCRPADEYHRRPPLWGLCFFFDGFFIEQGKIISEAGAFAASGHVGDALCRGVHFSVVLQKIYFIFHIVEYKFHWRREYLLLPGQAPEKAWTDLWLVAGHMSVREWATLNVSYQSLDAGYIPSGELGLLRRRIGWIRVGARKGAIRVWRFGGRDFQSGVPKVGPFRRAGAGFGTSSTARLPRFRSARGGRPPRGNPLPFAGGKPRKGLD